jgi:chemotaxis protein MotA
VDILTIAGILLALIAILFGNFMEGGQLASLYNAPALVIVLGGTLGAAMLQTPLHVLKHALKISIWMIKPPIFDFRENINKLIYWSQTSRREGLLGLEKISEEESDFFSRKGLQLLVDGCEPTAIRRAMENELNRHEAFDLQAAKVFDCMGGYAPTIGIIGAVMGLIHVMGNLADPSMLGSGIATAFVATIYGVALGNLVFLPIASKLKHIALEHGQLRDLMIEGIVAIAEGENPRTMEIKLVGYLYNNDNSISIDSDYGA